MNCSLSVRQTASCILIMYFFWFLYSEPFWYYCKSPFCIDDTEFLHAGCPTNLPYLCPSHTHAQPFYGPFSVTTRVSWCQKKSSSGLHGAREDNMRQTHRQSSGRHSIQINQRPTSIIPHFYAGCHSCCNSLNLSWLATGTKYHAFHTQWRGSVSALQWTIKCWKLLTVAWVSVVYTSVVCCMLSDVLLTKCYFHLLYESQLYLGIHVYMSSWDGCRCYNYGRPA